MGKVWVLAIIVGTFDLQAQENIEEERADKAAAEALFAEGLRLMKESRFQEACRQLERSQAVDPGIGTLLYLGECYELSGRTASAWAAFREASAAARAAGQEDRATRGAERAENLAARLSWLTIEVAEANRQIEGIHIERAGSEVPVAVWGTAVPVDPGTIEVTAKAPEYESWSGSIDIAEAGEQYSLGIPELVPLAVEAPSDEAKEPLIASEPTLLEPDTSSFSSQQMAGLIVAGVGLVGMGIGGAYGLRAISKDNDADRSCTDGVCMTAEGARLSREAADAATIANVGVVGGGVLVAVGAGLFLLSSSEEPEASVRWTPAVDLRGAGLSVHGRF